MLRSRSYRLLWSAQFAALLAGYFNYVAVAWLTLRITGSSLAVGAVLAAASVPQAALMLLGGAASDRSSPRTTMLAASLARGIVMGVLAVLTLTRSVQLWQLFAAAVLVGATTAFFVPASASLLPRLVANDRLEAGNALLNLGRTLALVLGPAAAGVVVAVAGAGTALGADAAGSVLAGLLVAPLPAGGSVASTASPLGDVRDGLLHVWGDTPLRVVLLVVAALNFFALGAVEVGLPALAHLRFGPGAVALGSAFAAWGLGSTLGSLGAGARPVPGRIGRLTVVMVAMLGAGIAAAGVAPTLPVLLVVMVAVGTVEGAGSTYLISWMQRRTEPGLQGRVMSLAMLASVGLEPVALAAAGAVASRDLGLLFWGSAIAVELTALLAALSRSVRRA
ncbi:MAG TPA: MFS transporter [Candidatus Dormibacteraeota bacterium]|nr:MFS transporter [Candidatus Dormibacteraeota bacterium]